MLIENVVVGGVRVLETLLRFLYWNHLFFDRLYFVCALFD